VAGEKRSGVIARASDQSASEIEYERAPSGSGVVAIDHIPYLRDRD